MSFAKTEQDDQLNISQLEIHSSKQPIQSIIKLVINNIWLIWFVISFVLLIRKITIYQSFVRYINAGQLPVSNIELLDKLSTIAGQASINKTIELCVNPLISSPLLIGFFHSCIMIPSTDISEKDFKYTVLHELTHYQPGYVLQMLVQIAACRQYYKKQSNRTIKRGIHD